jgi:hypothetical protein
MRRIACNYLIVDGKKLTNQVVELDDYRVIAYYPLIEELAMTEWVDGTVVIVDMKIVLL